MGGILALATGFFSGPAIASEISPVPSEKTHFGEAPGDGTSSEAGDPAQDSPPAKERSGRRRMQASSPRGHGGNPWHLDLELITDVPVDVGARVSAELPYRLLVSTSLGGLPGGYVDVINAIVTAVGGYDDTTASVISSALQSSLVWRTHVGWRPLRHYGLYFQAGYGLVTLGGEGTSGDLLALATGDDELIGTGNDVVELRSTLHMIDAEIGYQFLLVRDMLSIRAALGFAGTVGARTRADLTDTGLQPPRTRLALEEAATYVEGYLDGIYTQYVMTPVITVGVGYRFF